MLFICTTMLFSKENTFKENEEQILGLRCQWSRPFMQRRTRVFSNFVVGSKHQSLKPSCPGMENWCNIQSLSSSNNSVKGQCFFVSQADHCLWLMATWDSDRHLGMPNWHCSNQPLLMSRFESQQQWGNACSMTKVGDMQNEVTTCKRAANNIDQSRWITSTDFEMYSFAHRTSIQQSKH